MIEIEKAETVTLLGPVLPSMPQWWQSPLTQYKDKHDDDDKLKLGPTHRALYLQKMALAQMRGDPSVTGNFYPVELGQLEFLLLEGDPNLSVLFKKVDRDIYGRLRSWNISTGQQQDRRDGHLDIQGIATIPIVCFYILQRPIDQLNPSFERICIGLETRAGFSWVHTLWSAAEGISKTLVHPQMMLLGEPIVKLRKPKAAELPSIGVRKEQQRKQNASAGKDESLGIG